MSCGMSLVSDEGGLFIKKKKKAWYMGFIVCNHIIRYITNLFCHFPSKSRRCPWLSLTWALADDVSWQLIGFSSVNCILSFAFFFLTFFLVLGNPHAEFFAVLLHCAACPEHFDYLFQLTHWFWLSIISMLFWLW